MKRSISLIALILAVIMLFTACGGTSDVVTTTLAQTTEGTTQATTQATTSKPNTDPETKSIKILAIGNSFSWDAMEHLWDILFDMGYTNITLGNMYIGGCSIDTHMSNAETGEKAYEYRYNKYGSWNSTKNVSLEYGVTKEKWDIITVQQVSQNSGMTETFGNLQNLINYVNSKKTNADAKVYWHMTWAYQQDTTHSGFANYGNSQAQMYEAITNAVKTGILTNEAFAGFIPAGTTIQNLRTSYLGDTLTRDGYHLSNGIGRYAAGMTWAKLLTGESIDNVTRVNKNFKDEVTPCLDVIKECVNNAIANPLTVTPSTMTTDPNAKPEEPKLPTVVTDLSITEALTDTDKAFLTAQGLDPNKYAVLKMTPVVHAYYNSTTATGGTLVSSANSTASNLPQFWATQEKFSTSQLPVGSVITIASGYQYRPEGFQTETGKNTGTRPGNVNAAVVTVTTSWWTGFNYRAFNVSKISGENVSASDTSALRIYVPIAE